MVFGDLDKALSQININPVDKDMRAFNVAIRRNIDKRYDKGNWLKQNFGMIVGGIMVLIGLIFLWLIVREYIGSLSTVSNILEQMQNLIEAQEDILNSLNNIVQGGSGIRPANG